MKSLLFQRIKQLCLERNITIKQLEYECGLTENTVYRWANTSPSFEKVKKVADYFKVSLDYLCGMTDIQSSAAQILSDDDMIALQRARENSTPANRKMMMDILRAGFKDAFGE